MIFLTKDDKKQIQELKAKIIRDKTDRTRFLSKDTDWAMLEQFIQRINDNPSLKIDITLLDGTKLSLYTTGDRKYEEKINGNY